MDSKRVTAGLAAVFAAMAINAAEPYATAIVTVDPGTVMGPVKLMNSVNGGPMVAPVMGDQKRGNFEEYKALAIPMARTHDAINCVSGGAHTGDISALFPNFDADENDPKNYDFVFTDHYLDAMVRAGTKPFFRLGQTIEHGPKKYGALPPKDFAKWARICEHVIRHYNEGGGWGVDRAYTTQNIAWSNQFNIVYWEIWNEPDLDPSDDPAKLPRDPRCWGGTVTNYFNLYETAAKHLKAKFPHLKIGGPALCGNWDYGDRFLRYCRDTKSPLDFFSWHIYAVEPATLGKLCHHWREVMDKYGFEKSESILNEWNYVKGWSDDWVYSLEAERGRFNQKGAAFIAGAMIDCQYAPLDHLMYYDARPTGMNGMFDNVTMWPMKGYYPFYAWKRLLAYGTQVKCEIREGRGKKTNAATGIVWENGSPKVGDEGFRAVAAKDAAGKVAVFIVRYKEDNNVTDTAEVTFRVPSGVSATPRAFVTDEIRTYTEVPLDVKGKGEYFLKLRPNSFAFVEF